MKTIARYAVLIVGAVVGSIAIIMLGGCDTAHVAEVCVPLDSVVVYETTEDSTVFRSVVYKTPCN